jgi:hypothetical protein
VNVYIQFHMKFRYDKSYTSLLFNSGDIAFLNLHQNHRIPSIHSKKLAQQRIKFFKVIRRISPLVYELEIPNNINIYPVISIIYLKSILKDNDPYNRFHNEYSVSIKKDS